ncbi:MAG TPA: DinB family protein [Phycisphaerales bacterium]|nr:DinB family protein [Phycisphaerales bacterium]
MSASPKPDLKDFFALPIPDLVERFATGSSRLDSRLLKLDNEQLDTFFRPEADVGRWSCRVLVGHIADADLVFIHRMRRTVAEDHPVLAPFDEDAFIDAGLYQPSVASERGTVPLQASGLGPTTAAQPSAAPPTSRKPHTNLPIAGFVAVIHTLRLWHADWLRTLSNEAFRRTALHPQRGEQTVQTILVYDTWHLEHHAWFLDRKLDRLLGA